jgi:hypothetical protein
VYVLVTDDSGRLTLRKLRPWHAVLARLQAGQLDSELARGDDPESCEYLAVRAQQLTSAQYRHGLAVSLLRLLDGPSWPVTTRLVSRTRIATAAAELAELATRLEEPGLLPARGVAMVVQLLSESTGPLYLDHGPDALRDAARRAAQALA